MSTFRLQRLLDHRRRLRDEAQQRLAEAARTYEQARSDLLTLTAVRDRVHVEATVELASGPVGGDRLQLLHRRFEAVWHAVDRQAELVERSSRAALRARDEAAAAAQAHRTLENARERHEEQLHAERRRRETSTLDEISGVRVARAVVHRFHSQGAELEHRA